MQNPRRTVQRNAPPDPRDRRAAPANVPPQRNVLPPGYVPPAPPRTVRSNVPPDPRRAAPSNVPPQRNVLPPGYVPPNPPQPRRAAAPSSVPRYVPPSPPPPPPQPRRTPRPPPRQRTRVRIPRRLIINPDAALDVSSFRLLILLTIIHGLFFAFLCKFNPFLAFISALFMTITGVSIYSVHGCRMITNLSMYRCSFVCNAVLACLTLIFLLGYMSQDAGNTFIALSTLGVMTVSLGTHFHWSYQNSTAGSRICCCCCGTKEPIPGGPRGPGARMDLNNPMVALALAQASNAPATAPFIPAGPIGYPMVPAPYQQQPYQPPPPPTYQQYPAAQYPPNYPYYPQAKY